MYDRILWASNSLNGFYACCPLFRASLLWARAIVLYRVTTFVSDAYIWAYMDAEMWAYERLWSTLEAVICDVHFRYGAFVHIQALCTDCRNFYAPLKASNSSSMLALAKCYLLVPSSVNLFMSNKNATSFCKPDNIDLCQLHGKHPVAGEEKVGKSWLIMRLSVPWAKQIQVPLA